VLVIFVALMVAFVMRVVDVRKELASLRRRDARNSAIPRLVPTPSGGGPPMRWPVSSAPICWFSSARCWSCTCCHSRGPNGGVTFPLVGISTVWFKDILRPGQMANIPVASGARSRWLRLSVLLLCWSRLPGLGFRRRYPGSGILFFLAVASLVMPSLLVGFGIGLGFKVLGIDADLFTSALDAQLTWTLPFGLFAMVAVLNRFDLLRGGGQRSGRDRLAATASCDIADPVARIVGVAMGAFTLSYDEYARTTPAIGSRITLRLEIYALISSATSPTLFAIGTVTAAVSFCATASH
jgi:putative spermidine/putrescine transport system permease protein